MSSDWMIRCTNVGKAYQIYAVYDHRLMQMLFGRFKKFYQDFWVLRNISFEVKRGECVGVMGRNGAGKTTLLQLICGITEPTHGEILTRGRIAPVLALGSAFDLDLTGRENVLVGGAVLGLKRARILKLMNSIQEFSGIGEFFDRPVKFYSSGMAARLAFAICAHVDADILIIDEALAVGDEAFQEKCLKFIDDFRARGTVFFVSHSAKQIESLCSRVIWIENGAVREIGDPEEITRKYQKALVQEKDDSARFHIGN
ncbi:MAG TPA: ABC transporter ATP-binding protein [Xanthobacteraceae bacterium]|nr:ABC transporter ATP-binding protein [Xanthobacteraceae bacterium]